MRGKEKDDSISLTIFQFNFFPPPQNVNIQKCVCNTMQAIKPNDMIRDIFPIPKDLPYGDTMLFIACL